MKTAHKVTRKRDPKSTTRTDEKVVQVEQQRYAEKLRKHQIDELGRILKPQLELEKAIQADGPDSPLAKAMRDRSGAACLHAEDPLGFRAPRSAHDAFDYRVLQSLHCSGSLLRNYSNGDPLVEQVGDCITGSWGCIYKTSTALAIPSTGILSVGVANGHWMGQHWPSSTNWGFGDANYAVASISQDVPMPFIGGPKKMDVTIDVFVGDPLVVPPLGGSSFETPGSLGSTGNGLAGVMGSIYLTLSDDQATSAPRSTRKIFLFKWASHGSSNPEPVELRQFTLSETLVLEPGAGQGSVEVTVGLLAFSAGINEPSGGFSAIDLRLPYSSGIYPEGVYPGLPRGPVTIQKMSISLCPLPSTSGLIA